MWVVILIAYAVIGFTIVSLQIRYDRYFGIDDRDDAGDVAAFTFLVVCIVAIWPALLVIAALWWLFLKMGVPIVRAYVQWLERAGRRTRT